jgi:hypothetical protein
MARGKPWTEEEIGLLIEMAGSGMGPQQIYDSGRLPGRTFRSIVKQLYGVAGGSGPSVEVVAIEPALEALSMDKMVKLYTTAFEHISAMKEADRLSLERLRIIFQAAKDYGPLLAGYEKWDKIEKKINELSAAVAELQAAKSAKKA